MHNIPVIRLYFSIYALHVSGFISSSICRIWYMRIYQIRHTASKKIVAEDELIKSETCRAYIEK